MQEEPIGLGASSGAWRVDQRLRGSAHGGASRGGTGECVRALLEAGGKPDIKDSNGKTALDHAKETDNEEIITLLREHGQGK